MVRVIQGYSETGSTHCGEGDTGRETGSTHCSEGDTGRQEVLTVVRVMLGNMRNTPTSRHMSKCTANFLIPPWRKTAFQFTAGTTHSL